MSFNTQTHYLPHWHRWPDLNPSQHIETYIYIYRRLLVSITFTPIHEAHVPSPPPLLHRCESCPRLIGPWSIMLNEGSCIAFESAAESFKRILKIDHPPIWEESCIRVTFGNRHTQKDVSLIPTAIAFLNPHKRCWYDFQRNPIQRKGRKRYVK